MGTKLTEAEARKLGLLPPAKAMDPWLAKDLPTPPPGHKPGPIKIEPKLLLSEEEEVRHHHPRIRLDSGAPAGINFMVGFLLLAIGFAFGFAAGLAAAR